MHLRLPSPLPQPGPVRIAVVLMVAVTLYRFWFMNRLDLVPDEAYYWLWSKHLAASYRDKGPAVAWTIALGTSIFGPTVAGIRFFAVVLSTATGVILFQLARRLYDDRVALWSLLLAAVIPIIAVGSILMTIDSLSVFFWAWAALIFLNALQHDRTSTWVYLGLAIGAGFLAKFTNGVQLACILLFLACSREHRPWLLSRRIFAMFAAFFLTISPVIWWNCRYGWVELTALHSRSGIKDTFHVRPSELLKFIGGQFGVVSPLVMAGMIVAAVAFARRQKTDLRARFLLSQFLPLYALFLFFSLNSAGQPNWTAPALIPGVVFTVVYWREMMRRNPLWRWGVGASFLISLLMTIVMHDTDYLHLPPKKDPLSRAKGWEDFASHVQRAREKYQADLLISDHYSQASMMAFYLPDQPRTYLLPEPYGATQFTLWPTYTVQPGSHALYVTTSASRPPKPLRSQFDRVELVDDFWSQHHGRPVTEFRIYACTSQLDAVR